MNSSGILNYLTKAVGVAGLGLIAYDAHYAGKMEAPVYEKNHKAESLADRYIDDTKLESPSVIQSAVKKRLFQYNMDENLTGFFTSTAGYLKGFTSMLVGNVVPLGLSVGTFLGKGTFSKLCGAGLIAYGGIFLLQEAFGIGKSH